MLGFPDVSKLPYVKVETGAYSQVIGNEAKPSYAEGLLLNDEQTTFTVFVCSVSDFDRTAQFRSSDTTSPRLTTVTYHRKATGPAYARIDYQTLDFNKTASEVLERKGLDHRASWASRG